MNVNYKIMFLGLTGLLACKQPATTSAEVKSLDNFAKAEGEDMTVNRCGITYDGNLSSLPETVRLYDERIEASSQSLKNETLATLVSVPQTLLEIFYNVGGTIAVGNDAVAHCQEDAIADSEIDFLGGAEKVSTCWKQVNPGEPPVILIAGNADLIRHSLVRLFGYMFTEVFVARLSSDSAPDKYRDQDWLDAVEAFTDMRQGLAEAFLSDLRSSNKSAYSRLSAFQSNDKLRFENYVFAEALDSHYCSADTRDVFATDFKRAYALFTDKSNPESPAVQFGEMD